MVITIDSGTQALIYELAIITAIFGLDWARIFRQLYGLDWVSENGPMSNSDFRYSTLLHFSCCNLCLFEFAHERKHTSFKG